MEKRHFDVIVLGGGPAGLTAGIYLSRARLKTLILNVGTIGGQMVLTHEVANYPGIEHISGYALATTMKKQALSFGAELKNIRENPVMDLGGDIKRFVIDGGVELTADAVVLTPGGRSRSLGVPGEDTFRGQGISYCATCDGEFFTGKEIVVVGGGNSALEEAVSLAGFASKVTLVHQFDHFQAFPHAIEEVKSHPKIQIRYETEIREFFGKERFSGVMLRHVRTGELEEFPTDGVFIFIGYQPNTEDLLGQVALNERGEILVTRDMETNIPGVFAAGDSIVKQYRQITTAVGDATIAALVATAYVFRKEKEKMEI